MAAIALITVGINVKTEARYGNKEIVHANS